MVDLSPNINNKQGKQVGWGHLQRNLTLAIQAVTN